MTVYENGKKNHSKINNKNNKYYSSAIKLFSNSKIKEEKRVTVIMLKTLLEMLPLYYTYI